MKQPSFTFLLPLALVALAACQSDRDDTGAESTATAEHDVPVASGTGSPADATDAAPDVADAESPAGENDEAPAASAAEPMVDASRDAPVVAGGGAPAKQASAAGGKPSAPINIDYRVIGTPIVGQPVSIDLDVSSTAGDKPVALRYSIVDAGSLTFPASQVREVSLGAVARKQPASQQVTVVPQREGRLYLNVTAEIETDSGTLLKAMAIPIQVGKAPPQREENGELKEDANGDAIVSLPADEN